MRIQSLGQNLDTGKADRDKNPHHQLQDYLSTLRVRFGFLTNGRIWRMYDTDKITAKKTFIEFDLERLWALEDAAEKAQALALFAFFFGRDTYLQPAGAGQVSAIEQAIAASADFTLEVEENLKAVIYGYAGEDSLFEIMGRAIHQANPKASLASVYENSVVLLFRLLFVVYFEDKNHDLLASTRSTTATAWAIFSKPARQAPTRARCMTASMPSSNSLKCSTKAPKTSTFRCSTAACLTRRARLLLLTPKIFDNATLRQLLEKLLYKTAGAPPCSTPGATSRT